MLKPYFKDGVLSEEAENITSEFIQAISIGFVRYLGTAREAESGAEIPTSVLLSHDGHKKSKEILKCFADSLETIGLEVGDAGELDKKSLKLAFFELKFDAGIYIEVEKDRVKIELFERGDEIGGLEANLPGGVNFRGKTKKVPYALPIPQIAVNHIEHALNTKARLEYINEATLVRDCHAEALKVVEKIVK